MLRLYTLFFPFYSASKKPDYAPAASNMQQKVIIIERELVGQQLI